MLRVIATAFLIALTPPGLVVASVPPPSPASPPGLPPTSRGVSGVPSLSVSPYT